MKKITLWSFLLVCGLSFAQPANDNCANAIPLTIQPNGQACTPSTYSNVAATHEAPQPSCDAYDIASVWFKFTPNSSQTSLKLVVNNITTDYIDADIFTNCSGTYATGLSSNCFSNGGGVNSVITGFVTGTTYYLRIGNTFQFDTQGDFGICISAYTPPPTPVNDLCSGALVLYYDIPYSFNTESATTDSIFTAAGDYIYQDVWFSFTAPYNVMYDVTSCGSDYDTQIAVYQANDCSTIVDNSEIAYDDDDNNCLSNDLNSFAQFTGTAGVKYYVRVGGYGNNDFGPSSILITNPNSGIDEIAKVSFELAPNPANNNVSLTFENSDLKTITVVDLTGKVVQTREVSATQVSLDVSNFEKGMYLIKVSSEKGEGVKRLMKE